MGARWPRRLKQDSCREYTNYVKSYGCASCGENRLPCLDLHHFDPASKEYNIAHLITYGSMAKLKAELAKCIVLCANCHRLLHSIVPRRRKRQPRHYSPWQRYEHFWLDQWPQIERSMRYSKYDQRTLDYRPLAVSQSEHGTKTEAPEERRRTGSGPLEVGECAERGARQVYAGLMAALEREKG